MTTPTNKKRNSKTSIKATIISYNKEKQIGEAKTDRGEKILVVPNSFEDKNVANQLKPNDLIECEIFPQRQKGFYAYSAKVVNPTS